MFLTIVRHLVGFQFSPIINIPLTTLNFLHIPDYFQGINFWKGNYWHKEGLVEDIFLRFGIEVFSFFVKWRHWLQSLMILPFPKLSNSWTVDLLIWVWTNPQCSSSPTSLSQRWPQVPNYGQKNRHPTTSKSLLTPRCYPMFLDRTACWIFLCWWNVLYLRTQYSSLYP